MPELTYEQALLFAMRTVASLAEETNDYIAGYCHAAGHLLGNILDAVTDLNTDDAEASEEETI